MVHIIETQQGREKEPKPCLFCEISQGREVSSMISGNESALAFMSLEGYPLVIPRKHITPENITGHIQEMSEVAKLAFSLVDPTKKALQASGITVVANIGKSAGQEISHVHMHLINRNTRDGKVKFTHIAPLQRGELNLRAQRIKSQIT